MAMMTRGRVVVLQARFSEEVALFSSGSPPYHPP